MRLIVFLFSCLFFSTLAAQELDDWAWDHIEESGLRFLGQENWVSERTPEGLIFKCRSCGDNAYVSVSVFNRVGEDGQIFYVSDFAKAVERRCVSMVSQGIGRCLRNDVRIPSLFHQRIETEDGKNTDIVVLLSWRYGVYLILNVVGDPHMQHRGHALSTIDALYMTLRY